MGTMITLGVGKSEINWGKNDIFENFCDLFQPEDWKDIKYYYADDVVEIKKGYSRNLSLVKSRLDLLGCTLKDIKTIYENTYSEYCDGMGKYATKCIFEDEQIQKLLKKYTDGRGGEFYENLPQRLLIRG